MDNDTIAIVVTIGLTGLLVAAALVGSMLGLLNHLGKRIDQTEARLTRKSEKDKAELLEAIRDTERRLGHRIDRLEDRLDATLLRHQLDSPAAEERLVAEGD